MGLTRVHVKAQRPARVEPIEFDCAINVDSREVIDLRSAPSASDLPCQTPGRYCEGCPCPYCSRRKRELDRQCEDLGPPRVRGEMVWLKKDVSILRIQGRADLTPEEFSENRRR